MRLRTVLSVCFCVLAVGCATYIPQPVLESDKDTAKTFDGRWVGVANTGKCADNEWNKQIRVQQGVISFVHNGGVEKTFLNQDGDFRFDVGESTLLGKLGSGKGEWKDAGTKCSVTFERA